MKHIKTVYLHIYETIIINSRWNLFINRYRQATEDSRIDNKPWIVIKQHDYALIPGELIFDKLQKKTAC